MKYSQNIEAGTEIWVSTPVMIYALLHVLWMNIGIRYSQILFAPCHRHFCLVLVTSIIFVVQELIISNQMYEFFFIDYWNQLLFVCHHHCLRENLRHFFIISC